MPINYTTTTFTIISSFTPMLAITISTCTMLIYINTCHQTTNNTLPTQATTTTTTSSCMH
jgi:ATP sulfurylase